MGEDDSGGVIFETTADQWVKAGEDLKLAFIRALRKREPGERFINIEFEFTFGPPRKFQLDYNSKEIYPLSGTKEDYDAGKSAFGSEVIAIERDEKVIYRLVLRPGIKINPLQKRE